MANATRARESNGRTLVPAGLPADHDQLQVGRIESAFLDLERLGAAVGVLGYRVQLLDESGRVLWPRKGADSPAVPLRAGSGKEAFAHAMHLASRRASGPFVAVNCAAIPEPLIESELFGYRPGAFTGARREGLRGKILQSSGGTLFLDEIGDMPLALQTRLLRALEQRAIVPLGGEAAVEVDLHVIAASHRNLRDMIACGAFREDLYYRLNGITLELPALRERADREQLIRQALAAETADGRPAAIEPEALARLLAWSWPGNIRELRNVIRTALAICDGGVIRWMDLPREIRAGGLEARGGDVPEREVGAALGAAAELRSENALHVAERTALLQVIEQCGGNMTRVASQLGMSRNTLYRRIKRHGIPLRHGPAAHGD